MVSRARGSSGRAVPLWGHPEGLGPLVLPLPVKRQLPSPMGTFLTSRYAALGSGSLHHCKACSSTFSLGCRGRSGDTGTLSPLCPLPCVTSRPLCHDQKATPCTPHLPLAMPGASSWATSLCSPSSPFSRASKVSQMSRLAATLRISSTWLVSSSAVIVGDTWGQTHKELQWVGQGGPQGRQEPVSLLTCPGTAPLWDSPSG